MSEVKPILNPHIRETKYQTVSLDVNTPASGPGAFSQSEIDFELDKQYNKLIGVAFEITPSGPGVTTDNLKIGRFEVNNREIYSEGLPVNVLLNTNDVNFNAKFDRHINEKAAGVKTVIHLREYNSAPTFVPYTVNIIFQLSNA